MVAVVTVDIVYEGHSRLKAQISHNKTVVTEPSSNMFVLMLTTLNVFGDFLHIRHTCVCFVPETGRLSSLFDKEAGDSLSTLLENWDWCRPVCLPSSVATTPGWTAFTVTPDPVPHTHTHTEFTCTPTSLQGRRTPPHTCPLHSPCNRLASSLVNRTLASLLWQYARLVSNFFFSQFRSSKSISPAMWASEARLITRLGADSFNLSSRRFVNKKWPGGGRTSAGDGRCHVR